MASAGLEHPVRRPLANSRATCINIGLFFTLPHLNAQPILDRKDFIYTQRIHYGYHTSPSSGTREPPLVILVLGLGR